MHWVLHPTGALESGEPNIHPDRHAQFHALCVYREIAGVIGRQTDRSRQYEAYVESVRAAFGGCEEIGVCSRNGKNHTLIKVYRYRVIVQGN
jgi:hypothetical protein